MKISIIIPLFNESENIKKLYEQLSQTLKKDFIKFNKEIIFVDDGSEDDTYLKLVNLRKKDKSIKIIKFSRNFGHHIALHAGMNYATGDIICFMDGDLQERPEEIKKLYSKMENKFDIVFGIKKIRNDSFIKKFTSVVFWTTLSRISGIKIVPNQTTLRIFNKKVLKSLITFKESSPFYAGIFSWIGFSQSYVYINIDKRYRGKSKYTFVKMLNLTINALLGFSNKPLYYISYFGIALSLVSFFIGIFYLIRKVFFQVGILGWPTIIILITFIGGIIILSIGILGIYISKIYQESLKRPLYIIDKKNL